VKNNLQTIASLLRLQARRLQSPEAKAALVESERRIRSIAIVHETLSRDAGDVVRFSEIVRPLTRLVEDASSSAELAIRFVVHGDAGELPGEVATPLAVVLNELMQNAVDHAFVDGVTEGRVDVFLSRDDDHVTMEVRDDGEGLPDRFSLETSRGLGLTIVQALVTGELGGSIEMRSDNGASVRVTVPVAMPRVEL
jgi:two-component sensor histidine kinase